MAPSSRNIPAVHNGGGDVVLCERPITSSAPESLFFWRRSTSRRACAGAMRIASSPSLMSAQGLEGEDLLRSSVRRHARRERGDWDDDEIGFHFDFPGSRVCSPRRRIPQVWIELDICPINSVTGNNRSSYDIVASCWKRPFSVVSSAIVEARNVQDTAALVRAPFSPVGFRRGTIFLAACFP